VFSSTNFLKMNGGEQKQFLTSAANVITQNMVKDTMVQNCVCAYADGLSVRSVCINKDRKEVVS
jgi:hypothetical protein